MLSSQRVLSAGRKVLSWWRVLSVRYYVLWQHMLHTWIHLLRQRELRAHVLTNGLFAFEGERASLIVDSRSALAESGPGKKCTNGTEMDRTGDMRPSENAAKANFTEDPFHDFR
jgi:hypothetical protein